MEMKNKTECIQIDKKERIHVRLDPGLIMELKILAAKTGKTIKGLVTDAVVEMYGLDEHGNFTKLR